MRFLKFFLDYLEASDKYRRNARYWPQKQLVLIKEVSNIASLAKHEERWMSSPHYIPFCLPY